MTFSLFFSRHFRPVLPEFLTKHLIVLMESSSLLQLAGCRECLIAFLRPRKQTSKYPPGIASEGPGSFHIDFNPNPSFKMELSWFHFCCGDKTALTNSNMEVRRVYVASNFRLLPSLPEHKPLVIHHIHSQKQEYNSFLPCFLSH